MRFLRPNRPSEYRCVWIVPYNLYVWLYTDRNPRGILLGCHRLRLRTVAMCVWMKDEVFGLVTWEYDRGCHSAWLRRWYPHLAILMCLLKASNFDANVGVVNRG